MSAEQQKSARYSPEEFETEEISKPKIRSRTSTTTTTATTSTSNSKTDQPSAALSNSSSLPSPVIPQPNSKTQKSTRGGARKSNKSTRRSSLNQKKETKKKSEPTHSPPTLPHPLHQHEPIPEDDANITRCVCGEDNEEANDVIMFQCDKCSVWQHGPCVGLYAEFPGDYFCETCRPDLHTTGQYQKSTTHQPSHRSPSFTSSTGRRERVNPDAASLAAFLTDAGVKPEDQLSLGGFALPTFAQTRRQSNMLVDGVAPLVQKKQSVIDASSSGTTESILPSSLNDLNKTKRKRLSLEQIESPTIPNVEPAVEDKPKRPRLSPAPELPSPAASASTTTSKLYNPPIASPLFSGPIGKQKRGRKVDDTDESCVGTSSSNKSKANGVFANRHPVPVSTSATGRRGSPTKRAKEDGRRTKQQHVTEQQQAQQQQQQRQQQVEAVLSEGWGLPDHLSYLEYLLPSPFPQPLVIEDLGEGPESRIFETPAKVKFPSKRTTIPDLRKRSKHIVDYLQKVQIESSDREKRNALIAKSLSSKLHQIPTDKSKNLQDQTSHNPPPANSFATVQSVVSPKTLEIIDDLSRQLYHWQEKFKQN